MAETMVLSCSFPPGPRPIRCVAPAIRASVIHTSG